MKLSRRANTIILWAVSIGLLAGMVITFTPNLGFGAGSVEGPVALRVNGEPIREMQVVQARANPLFSAVVDGEIGEDLNLLLADSLVRQELVRQESSRQRVSNGDVNRAVNDFRASRGIDGRRNDTAYLSLIAGSGFTDQTFREYMRGQLQTQAWEQGLIGDVEVSDEEVQVYFQGNRQNYMSEERVLARHIVTNDAETADLARARLLDGESAGLVARELSVERADRDGALGVAAGVTEPQPVGRPALPTAVANAAFTLRGPGITDVVSADGRFHVVVVEAYLPPAQIEFEAVAAQVRDDALTAKQTGVLEAAVDRLAAAARIETPAGGSLVYRDYPVARVGDTDIMATRLVSATYTNPQIQQALSPDNAFLITAFFKPAVLGQLVDQELAVQGAAELGVPFVGPRAVQAQSALNYVARDAAITDEAVQAYYQQSIALFTVPASAVTVLIDLPDLDAALAFRSGMLRGGSYQEVAAEVGAEVQELGTVAPGQLEGLLDVTLFSTDAFEGLPDSAWAISDVLVLSEPAPLVEEEEADAAADEAEEADAGETPEVPVVEPAIVDRFVILLADRTPERTRTLDEVRAQVESSVLAQERAELRNTWINGLRERIPVVENLLAADFSDPLSNGGFIPDQVEDEAGGEVDDEETADEDGDAPAPSEDEADEDVPAADED